MDTLTSGPLHNISSHVGAADVVALALCSHTIHQLLVQAFAPEGLLRLTGYAPFVVSLTRLHWAVAMGLPRCDARLCEHAASIGNWVVLQRARDLSFAWDSRTPDAAAAAGHAAIVAWALDSGCRYRDDIEAVAAAVS